MTIDINKILNFKTTEEIEVSDRIIDQIIGQDHAIEIIKKAAKQRRHLLLIGDPGTGKSMVAQALAEILSEDRDLVSNLQDILAFPNPKDEYQPIIVSVPAGQGEKIIEEARKREENKVKGLKFYYFLILLIAILTPWYFYSIGNYIMAAATFIGTMILFAGLSLSFQALQKQIYKFIPKLLVDNKGRRSVPFVDATGAHEGMLFGDVLHDPFQSGGLETPAHQRVIPGAIHKANGGVLFVDEIGTLRPEVQIELLTVLQEKKYPIYGRSERSAGSMVRTTPAPADFVLVAAGNIETLKRIHPALRSRIRGYGYEILMNNEIEYNEENIKKFARFVAQEVKKDEKIPHFTKEAVIEIIKEAQRRSGSKKYLTLRLRDLGGLVRLAGDIAKSNGKRYVDLEDVLEAKKLAATLEEKLVKDYIKKRKEYSVIKTSGYEVGRVNGLAVIGSRIFYSGIVLPLEAEVVPGKGRGRIIATGNLGKIAKEAIINVSTVVKKLFNEDLKKYDVHVQFLQTYEGVEGDSASIAVATAIISALKNWKIRQDLAMTGSLSIRGEVLAVGGIIAKVEAAIEAGLKEVIIPKANLDDVPEDLFEKIKVTPVESIDDVIKVAVSK
ncbi:ATP-dependent protease LonB [Nanoarchaeota archaeon NZ13-N]|nr:MAG: ATP-dependent protease LonB [Nanoarchaeota archaeon NZ13-N]